MRRVTYSRNHTLSLSRTCSCYCKYCSFSTHKPHLLEPPGVEAQIDGAARAGCKELLVLAGEAPDRNAAVAERLLQLGHADFVDYVAWVCRLALDRGLLPHSNIGVLTVADLERLREVNASLGLMLESVSERLMETVHAASPEKHPDARLATIDRAGRARIPFTTGILVGVGETYDERIDSLRAIAASHEAHGHVQEVILQNFVPHPSYHGLDVAEVASSSAGRAPSLDGDRGGEGRGVSPGPSDSDAGGPPMPAWASPVTLADMRDLISACGDLMPGVAVQVPPNLSEWWPELVAAGATDLGGLSSNGDHISPELPFPSPLQVRRRLARDGFALTERLCVHRGFISEEWLAPAVLDVIRERHGSFAPDGRQGLARRRAPRPQAVSRAAERGYRGDVLTDEDVTALLGERRADGIEEIRQAADALRRELAGDTVTFVVNRNVNFTNICTVGCAFCGFGRGRRAPDAYEVTEADYLDKVAEAAAFGATEICLQGGIHPDYDLSTYGRWLELARAQAPEIHLHAYSPMEIHFMCERSRREPEDVFRHLIDRGLGSTPGTAAEILDDGVRRRISPNKLPAARWLEIVEAAHSCGLRSTATIMFGHIEEPWELARHMRAVRELQDRTGGITEFVPLPFVPYQTALGRKYGIEEIATDRNLQATAVLRLALGRSIASLQASWVKMGLEGATEALRWGVNDLGGTLMEESISRMAGSGHGVRRDPAELIAAAHAAGRPAAQRTTLYATVRAHPVGEPIAV